jgi:hypothetical protein
MRKRIAFLRALILSGIIARHAELQFEHRKARQTPTLSEEQQCRHATKQVAYVHRICRQFAKAGINCQDLSSLESWPDASTVAGVLSRIQFFLLRHDYHAERFDPERIDLKQLDLATLDLRTLNPAHYLV